MASKAQMLKSGANKASKGLFSGMTKLNSENEEQKAGTDVTSSKQTEIKAEEPIKTEAIAEKPVIDDEITSKAVSDNKADVVESNDNTVETVEEPAKNEAINEAINEAEVQYEAPKESHVDVNEAPRQEIPHNTIQDNGQQHTGYNYQQYMNSPQMNGGMPGYAMQGQTAMQQMPVYNQQIDNMQYQQPVINQQSYMNVPQMNGNIQMPAYSQSAPKVSELKKTRANKQENSRYEKDKFLLLDIRGYRDYVEHMAKAANTSATKYIRNLIEQDMNKNMDIYQAHKALEEQLKGRI